jgi:flagellar biosynthesis protein FlhB
MSDDDTEREHEPSQKKLEDARKKGEIVRSAELSVAAAYGGLLISAAFLGPAILHEMGERAMAVIDTVADNPQGVIGGGFGGAIAMMVPALPIFAVPALAVMAVLIAQRALIFTPEKIAPKLSRISPMANAKQKFGRTGLAEFIKSFAKLLIVSLLLGLFVASELPRMIETQQQDAQLSFTVLLSLFTEFLARILAVIGSIAILDWFWQRHEFLRRNRMSRQELMDEFKESDGDPQMKGQRRRRAEAIAMQRMLTDVPKADVVIVNPTHYAVALRWDRGSGRAPVCVAKGVDEMAARIREVAVTAGVPIRSDPPSARALHASVEIGREIPPEHYAPVAAAIRFAETMRWKARKSWR